MLCAFSLNRSSFLVFNSKKKVGERKKMEKIKTGNKKIVELSQPLKSRRRNESGRLRECGRDLTGG